MVMYGGFFCFLDTNRMILFEVYTRLIKEKKTKVEVSVKNQDFRYLDALVPFIRNFSRKDFFEVDINALLYFMLLINPLECKRYMKRLESDFEDELPEYLKRYCSKMNKIIDKITEHEKEEQLKALENIEKIVCFVGERVNKGKPTEAQEQDLKDFNNLLNALKVFVKKSKHLSF